MKRMVHNIAVVGAGVIGMSCALEMARRGARVTIFDPEPAGFGTSWAAAGMIAPAFEAAGGAARHPRLLDLCLESGRLWPQFVADLKSDTRIDTGLVSRPTLVATITDDDRAAMDGLMAALLKKSVPFDLLTAAEMVAIDPSLSPDIASGIALPTDMQVDNRRLVLALRAALVKYEVEFIARRIRDHSADRAMLARFDATVWSRGHVETGLQATVRGQAFSVAPYAGAPRHVVRRGAHYIVPKRDRLVIGATSEPGELSTTTDARSIARLRQEISELVPSLANQPELEQWVGFRPSTSDHAPILGQTSDHDFVATGHYRNGILLAPVTAKVIADAVLDGTSSDLADAFSTKRFAAGPA